MKLVVRQFSVTCLIAAIFSVVFIGAVSATSEDGLIPPMHPSMHLCTGYPTSPPTYTPTPTPQPSATPVSEHIDTNLCAGDSYVSAHSPNTNFGDSQVLSMRKNEYLTYLRFNLHNLDPNAAIIHTYLRLTPFEIPPVSSTIKLYTTASNWNEETITYNNRPARQGQVGSLYVWTSTDPIEINITEIIRNAYDQGLAEISFIAEYDSSYFDLNVESQETARPPLLKIFYNTSGAATPTPTPEPTTGPGKLTTEISLNKAVFKEGDNFILTATFSNKQPYSVNASLWVVLDAAGAMWFWPGWEMSPDFQNSSFIPGEGKVLTPLQFVWPAVTGSGTGIKVWSAILDEAHDEIAVDHTTFGWE